MKLWLLQPIDTKKPPFEPWFDKCFGSVVRAETEADARKIASEHDGDEGPEAWLDQRLTTCTELTASGAADLVLSDFRMA